MTLTISGSETTLPESQASISDGGIQLAPEDVVFLSDVSIGHSFTFQFVFFGEITEAAPFLQISNGDSAISVSKSGDHTSYQDPAKEGFFVLGDFNNPHVHGFDVLRGLDEIITNTSTVV